MKIAAASGACAGHGNLRRAPTRHAAGTRPRSGSASQPRAWAARASQAIHGMRRRGKSTGEGPADGADLNRRRAPLDRPRQSGDCMFPAQDRHHSIAPQPDTVDPSAVRPLPGLLAVGAPPPPIHPAFIYFECEYISLSLQLDASRHGPFTQAARHL